MQPRCKYPNIFSRNDDQERILDLQKKHESFIGQQDKIIEKISEIEKDIAHEKQQSCVRSIRGPNFYYIHLLELEKQVLEKMNEDITQKKIKAPK